MIRNDEQLAAQLEALGCIERALESLRSKLMPDHPKNFAIYSEGYVDQIDELKAEIDEYMQRQKAPTTPAAEHAISSETARGTAVR